jgi:hypothetical protein
VTFAPVGSFFSSDSSGTTWTLAPSTVGDLLVVPILTNSATVYATALSSSNASWTLVAHSLDATNTASTSLFLGKVTSATSQTVTITWSGTTPSYVRGVGHEFSSTVGSWALDVFAGLSSSGTTTWPSLTPTAGSGELYYGYALNNGTAVVGSTSGYTYNVDSHGNGEAFNAACTSATQTVVWGDGGQKTGIMALVKETGATPFRPVLVRARIPQARARGVYMGTGPKDTSFGTGQIQWNAGAPVVNPAPGPVFRQKTFVRACIPQIFSKGRVESNPGAPVHNPAPGPVFRQKISPVRYLLPVRGRIYVTTLKRPLPIPGSGPSFFPATQALRARMPQQPLLRGRIASSSGAPVSNPAPGPVFIQRSFIRAQQPLPRRGICRVIKFSPAQVRYVPSPLYPLQSPVRAPIPPLQPRAGRVGSNPGAPVNNPGSGPVIFPAGQPAGVRVIFLATGRARSTPTAPAGITPASPVFTQKPFPARARSPLPPRGRVYRNSGTPAVNPHPGPVFRQATSPVRTRITLPPRGRIVSNPGGPVAVSRISAPFIQRSFIRAQQPLGRRGVCRTIRFGPAAANPQPGPVFYPAVTPIRGRITPPPRGRIYSNPGGPVVNPPVVSPFKGITSPVRVHPGLPPRGRIASSPGAPLRNPQQGPVFHPAVQPIRVRIPQNFSKGRISSNAGAPLQNPNPGPVFRQATSPVKAKLPRQQFFPKGRISSNPGGPVTVGGAGPVFLQKTSPARARIPQNAPRGRISFNAGAPLHNPQSGPAFVRAVRPAQARIPQVFSKGRVYSNPGGPVVNPVFPPPVYPLKNPVRTHLTLPPRGRISSNQGIPGPRVAPVYPLQHPVRAQFPLPPRGRVYSNPGTPPPVVVVPAKVYPLRGPVQARRPLPPHGRITLGNKGAPVHNPAAGPVFRQAVRPIRAIIPQNAPRGRTSSNPGGPIMNPSESRAGAWKAGQTYTRWRLGQPYTCMSTGGE